MNRKIKFVAVAVRWFDKYNGNTYHSVRVTRCRDGKTIACPLQYGYGDHYRQTALGAMEKAKWIPAKYSGKTPNGGKELWSYERENGYPIEWTASDGLKRECVRNGEL